MLTAGNGIILVLALIVFVPKWLPEIGKQLEQTMRELCEITRRK